MKIRLGEPTFVSIQGEGALTGRLSVWTRFFGCNLRCPGFFQKDPKDPSTYIDPLSGVDPKDYISIFQLPVVEVGCDTIYGIDPRFKHCATNYETEHDLVNEIVSLLPTNTWKHAVTGQTYDWCLTGGEPLMNQKAIIALYDEMYARDNFPYDVQIESNGTQKLTPAFVQLVQETTTGRELGKTTWYWSFSPKLHCVSGEPAEKAWKPECIKQAWDINPSGWLKFVVNGTEESWSEVASKVAELKGMGVDFPVFVMGVGATKEQQEDTNHISAIANRAIQEGYHFSGRLHCTIWGNTVGV